LGLVLLIKFKELVRAEVARVMPSNPGACDRKLEGVKPGEGQYRLRPGRWRFRYDIFGQDIVLHCCGLRREETYR